MPTSPNRISAITRGKLFDFIALSGLNWSGRLEETDFLGRIYKLTELPSIDTATEMLLQTSGSTVSTTRTTGQTTGSSPTADSDSCMAMTR